MQRRILIALFLFAAAVPVYAQGLITTIAGAPETVQIYCTGLGAVKTTPADGVASTGATATSATATVTIGGLAAPVAYSGLAPGFVGLYQVNAQVPSGLKTGDQPVMITINGATGPPAMLPVK